MKSAVLKMLEQYFQFGRIEAKLATLIYHPN